MALFLFGMDVMSKALERQAGGKLQTILAKMSSNVFKGYHLAAASCLDPYGDSTRGMGWISVDGGTGKTPGKDCKALIIYRKSYVNRSS